MLRRCDILAGFVTEATFVVRGSRIIDITPYVLDLTVSMVCHHRSNVIDLTVSDDDIPCSQSGQ